jgi:hypothetical protein
MPSFRHPRHGKQVTFGNHPVRFTLFGSQGKKKQGRMLASNPWRCIELALASEKKSAHDCLAYLRQAHDFHIASNAAKATARPLLMYYCFLNLAKMCIKHSSPSKDLTHAFHGIKEPARNTQRRRFTLTAQEVEVPRASGTQIPILREFASTLSWTLSAAGASYKVCDLLAQVPAIHRPYSHTRRRAERLYVLEEAELRYDHATRQAWAIVWIRKSEFSDTKYSQSAEVQVLFCRLVGTGGGGWQPQKCNPF